MASKSPDFGERRKAQRVAAEVALEVGGPDPSAGALEAVAHNISRHGVYCTINSTLDLFSKVRITLLLPDSSGASGGPSPTPIECTGVIVRREPVTASGKSAGQHLGIFFEEMAEEDRRRIDRFLGAQIQGEERVVSEEIIPKTSL